MAQSLLPVLAELPEPPAGSEAALQVVLTYHDCRLAVRAPRGLAASVAQVLSPFVTVADGPGADPVEVTVEVTVGSRQAAAAVADSVRANGSRIPIDASLYPTNTDGLRLQDAAGTVILIEATGTMCWFAARSTVVRIHAVDRETAQADLARVVKNLFTSWGERAGGILLHASAVLVDGQGIMLPADSRNGKTSLLLELLTGTECEMVSCDTVLLQIDDGSARLAGWPSNFSVSVGTVYDFPALVPLLASSFQGLSYSQAWQHYPKEVLSTHEVLDRIGAKVSTAAPLAATVFAAFDPAGTTSLVPLGDREQVRSRLRPVTLGSLDPLYPNWLGYWQTPEEVLAERIAQVAAWMCARGQTYQLTWAPGPMQLLRHVPLVDQAFQERRGSAMEGRR